MNSERNTLLREYKKTVEALGKMFYPFCEVVLHDLTKPDQAIIAIETSLTGRKLGDPTTNIGLLRLENKNTPDVLQNYQTVLDDGRVLKSTSIGIRDSNNEIFASLCLNYDVTTFNHILPLIESFLITENRNIPTKEYFISSTITDINKLIKDYCHENNKSILSLTKDDKQEIVLQLNKKGMLNLKNSIGLLSKILHVSRGTIYNYLNKRKSY